MKTQEIQEIKGEIREAVHQSSEMDSPVIAFVNGDHLSDSVCELSWNGDLVGIYYNESGEMVALDVWGEEHKAEKES